MSSPVPSSTALLLTATVSENFASLFRTKMPLLILLTSHSHRELRLGVSHKDAAPDPVHFHSHRELRLAVSHNDTAEAVRSPESHTVLFVVVVVFVFLLV